MRKEMNEQLLKASNSGDINTVIRLLGCGADLETTDNEFGHTPLLNASFMDRTDIVKLLLDRGANIDVKNKYGCTPLTLASGRGHLNTVGLLLSRGADVDVISFYAGNTALLLSSLNGYVEIVELLLHHCTNINVTNKDGRTCFDNTRLLVWCKEDIQELIINKQPHNIKFFDDNIGILPRLKEKHKEIIGLVEMGLF